MRHSYELNINDDQFKKFKMLVISKLFGNWAVSLISILNLAPFPTITAAIKWLHNLHATTTAFSKYPQLPKVPLQTSHNILSRIPKRFFHSPTLLQT